MLTDLNIRRRVSDAFRNCPRLTSRGRRLLLGAIVVLVAGLLVGNVVLVQLSTFFLFLIPLAVLASHMNLRGVTYDHALPEAAYRNEAFTVELRLCNAKPGLGAFDIQVMDEVVSRHQTEPTVLSVGPSDERSRIVVTRIRQRGVYEDFGYSLSSQFPLGLVENHMTGRLTDRLIVGPWSRQAPDIMPLLEAGVGHGGLRNRVSSDFIGEFVAMREYRTGDHPRRISWPFSVRFQKLIVKETEQPCPRNVSVLFHSYAPAGVVLSRRSFENSLELLVGLFEHLRESFIPVDFAASFNRWQRIGIDGGPAARHEFELVMATARMGVTRTIDPLVRVMQSEKRSSLVQLVVSNCPCRFWTALLPRTHIPVFCMDNTGEVTAVFREAGTVV